MPTPLPGEILQDAPPFGGGHPGLSWEKFFDEWEDDYAAIPRGGKLRWIDKFCNKPGDETQLLAAGKRREELFAAIDAKPMTMKLQSSFVTGMGYEHPVENGFLWHHTLGVPYLPGSSVKGMLRTWAREYELLDDIDRLFGSAKTGAGTLILFEAIPVTPVELFCEIVTPHDGGWRLKDNATPSDWNSPIPIPFLAMRPGAVFQFAIGARRRDRADDVDVGIDLLKSGLSWLGGGAKTNIGFGRFESLADLPLQVGDMVAVEDHSEAHKKARGKTGTIENVIDDRAKVKGQGFEQYVRLEFLSRVQQ